MLEKWKKVEKFVLDLDTDTSQSQNLIDWFLRKKERKSLLFSWQTATIYIKY